MINDKVPTANSSSFRTVKNRGSGDGSWDLWTQLSTALARETIVAILFTVNSYCEIKAY